MVHGVWHAALWIDHLPTLISTPSELVRVMVDVVILIGMFFRGSLEGFWKKTGSDSVNAWLDDNK